MASSGARGGIGVRWCATGLVLSALVLGVALVVKSGAPSHGSVRLPRDFGDRFSRSGSHTSHQHSGDVAVAGSDAAPRADATAPLARHEFFLQQRLDETGRIAPGVMVRALQHRKSMLAGAGAVADAGIDSTRWTWMGPGNIGGRVLSIVIHPVRTNEMLVGSAGGGIWKTIDGGASWLPINDFLGSLSIPTLAIDPQSPEVVYAGTGELVGAIGPIQGAGVYRSTDFGDTWVVSAQTVDAAPGGPWNYTNRLSVHPTNSNVILAGTARGGIFRSTDGGTLWTNELSGVFIGDIEFHPTDGTQAIAGDCCSATNGANQPNVFYYNAAAPGGPAWTRAAFTGTLGGTTLVSVGDCVPGSGNNDRITVVSTSAFRKDDPIIVGSALQASVSSIVDGTTLCVNVSVPPSTPAGTTINVRAVGRVELSYARSNPSLVYMSMAAAGGSLWQSTDGGQSYTPVATRLGHMWGQGAYNNAIWVDPTDPNHIVLGGGDLIATEDGGASFRAIGQGGHADRHWIVEHPNYDDSTNRVIFVGSDGGVYTGTNVRQLGMGGDTLQSLNNNLGVTQFIHLDVDTATGRMLGGTQDNGTLFFDPSTGTNGWVTRVGGDGGFSWIDPADPSFEYSEYVSARVTRNRRYFHATNTDRNGACCTDAGTDSGSNCIAVATPPPAGSLADACTGAANFYAPTAMDPSDSRRFLVGAARMWRTNDAQADPIVWSVIAGPAGICNSVSTNSGATCADDSACMGTGAACALSNISAIDIAPTNPDVVWIGYGNGTVYRTSNGTSPAPSWQRVDDNAPPMPTSTTGPLPRQFCTRVRIDPADTNRVYVAVGGYQGANLWKTEDSGATWQLISGGINCDPAVRSATALPCIQVNTIQIHPSQPGWLYAGTDLGVYTSENDGLTWSGSNDGPGNVIIQDLTWNDNEQLFAVTHGRGIFRTAPIVPDCDDNGVDDRIELALRDCNVNGRIDRCDVNSGESVDCNGNLLPDECEISVSSPAPGGPFYCVIDCQTDCDDNGVPDACDPDCNGNGQPDVCDLGSALTFVRTSLHVAGLAPSSIASADLNGDAFADVVVGNWESYDVSVMLNRGNGVADDWLGFEDAANYPTREVNAIPWAVTTGDFDLDGDHDVAYVSESGDIFRLESDLGVMLNNGDGTFAWPGFTPIHIEGIGPFRCESIVAGDLTGDGYPDLVVANTSSAGGIGGNKVTVIRNGGLNAGGGWRGFLRPLGVEAFPIVGLKPIELALGRFNTDGHLDLAVVNENSDDASILLNDGTGVFGAPLSIPIGVAPSALGVRDLNDDGYDDVLLARRTSSLVQSLRSAGDGTFTALPMVATGLAGVGALALGDVDLENSVDFVAGADSGTSSAVLLNDSTGGFGLPFPVSTGASAVSMTTLDVDADGDLDLASVGGNTVSRVVVVFNDTDIDCNRNGVPDHCEIAAGRRDADHDGLLDVCEVGACDADGDGDCDLADYRRLHACWQGPGIPCGGATAGAGTSERDLDHDFDFDLRDFAILQNAFTESRDCCEAHGAGCRDYAVEQCVCATMPACCTAAWDEACVGAIESLGCGACAPDALCGDGVCEGDENCVTCGYDCGLCPGACCTAHESPGCQDPATQACVCLTMPECCTDAWDEACANAAGDTCGACCGDGVCGLGEGCENCPLDCTDCPPGCGNTFCDVGEDCVSCPADCGVCPIECGDDVCNGDETCATCVEDCGPCEGACCIANGSIGCQDPSVTECVCSFDPDCCDVEWGVPCAQEAIQCGTCTSDCCAGGNTPGCFDYAVTVCVCDIDATCCTENWTPACAGIAGDACGACCGDQVCGAGEDCTSCPEDCGACPPVCGDDACDGDETCASCPGDCGDCTASCCLPHDTVGCRDLKTQECVCSFDDYCCVVQWDEQCAVESEQCGVCGGDCCASRNTPGCSDSQVEQCVCAADPYCCDVEWDDVCVGGVDDNDCGTCVDGPPTVLITTPAQDTTTSDGDFVYDGFDNQLGLYYKDVTLVGQATDPEDGVITGGALVWTTNRTDLQPGGQAQLGTGTSITVRIYSNNCPGVWHEISLTVTDSGGNVVSVIRRIFIWTLC